MGFGASKAEKDFALELGFKSCHSTGQDLGFRVYRLGFRI